MVLSLMLVSVYAPSTVVDQNYPNLPFMVGNTPRTYATKNRGLVYMRIGTNFLQRWCLPDLIICTWVLRATPMHPEVVVYFEQKNNVKALKKGILNNPKRLTFFFKIDIMNLSNLIKSTKRVDLSSFVKC